MAIIQEIRIVDRISGQLWLEINKGTLIIDIPSGQESLIAYLRNALLEKSNENFLISINKEDTESIIFEIHSKGRCPSNEEISNIMKEIGFPFEITGIDLDE